MQVQVQVTACAERSELPVAHLVPSVSRKVMLRTWGSVAEEIVIMPPCAFEVEALCLLLSSHWEFAGYGITGGVGEPCWGCMRFVMIMHAASST